MIGMGRLRSGFLAFAPLTALAVPAAAVGDHGSGGGGGGGVPPPPAGAPAVTFTPTSLTFAAQAIGTTSAPQSITIANTGNASLFINSAATRGANPLDFTQVSDGCSGLTLAPGTSCSVSITFAPTASGTRSATFILTDNAAHSPQTVPITGTGNVFAHRHRSAAADPAWLSDRRDPEGVFERSRVQRPDAERTGHR